jgi:hypothetical protein
MAVNPSYSRINTMLLIGKLHTVQIIMDYQPFLESGLVGFHRVDTYSPVADYAVDVVV